MCVSLVHPSLSLWIFSLSFLMLLSHFFFLLQAMVVSSSRDAGEEEVEVLTDTLSPILDVEGLIDHKEEKMKNADEILERLGKSVQ